MTGIVRNWDPFILLLIDVQKDFWTEEMSATFPDFEKNISNLLDYCRQEQIDVVHLRAEFQQDKSDWMAKYKLLERIPCIEGTEGAEVFPCAKEAPDEMVLSKQTFDGFHNPELESYLLQNNKRFLLIAGLVTSVCLLLTAANAAQRGYLVAMIENCCADEPNAHRHTLERYPFIFGHTTVNQIADNHHDWLAELDSLGG
jgi:nicotinamidase-related amidase